MGAFFGPVTVALVRGHRRRRASRASATIRTSSQALNPAQAVAFLVANPLPGFLVLGAVFLALTGGEALYADMGHFGKRPIRIAWFGLVMPALLLNYYGQGAFVLANPAAVKNPFYLMLPDWALLPMVALATAATVIASQAVISGAFSITRQAIHLGYIPRLEILHTSDRQIGQVYVPFINWTLFAAVILLVLGFKYLRQPGQRVRHRRVGHDGDRVRARDGGRAPALEVAAARHLRRAGLDARSSTSPSSPPTRPSSSPAAGSRCSSGRAASRCSSPGSAGACSSCGA